MTATDWRRHATEANQQRFADAQGRLDEGDYPPGEAGRAQQAEDQRFADWYDQAVNSAAQDEFERKCADDEFNARWPEPADGARIEWEDRGGTLRAAYRRDEPRDPTDPDGGPGAHWYVYGSDAPWTWQQLVWEHRLPEGLADVTLLVDAHAAARALTWILTDQPIPEGAAVGVVSGFHTWMVTLGNRREVTG